MTCYAQFLESKFINHTPNMSLFDESSLRKLEQLSLLADSVRVGSMKGDRQSRKRGSAIEFADYREYTPGDDLRRLDWNVFARLDRPFVKLTEEEEDLAVHILVDTSTSMDWPQGDDETETDSNKLRYAILLSGALGYLALASGDLVNITLFNSNEFRTWGPFRGRQNGWPLLQFLEANYVALTTRDGNQPRQTPLDHFLADYARRAKRPGLLFLVSDLLASNGFRNGLNEILSRGYEVALLHVHSPDEISPKLDGDLRLIDVETNETAEITIDALVIEEYINRLQEWHSGIATWCTSRGIHYLPITTDISWERIVMGLLREQGVVR